MSAPLWYLICTTYLQWCRNAHFGAIWGKYALYLVQIEHHNQKLLDEFSGHQGQAQKHIYKAKKKCFGANKVQT